MSDGFYSQPSWHKLRAKTKAVWKRENRLCGYCNHPIDWNEIVVVDHIKNRRRHPDLALEPSNLQCVHHACNTRKAAYVENGNKPAVREDGFAVGSDWC